MTDGPHDEGIEPESPSSPPNAPANDPSDVAAGGLPPGVAGPANDEQDPPGGKSDPSPGQTADPPPVESEGTAAAPVRSARHELVRTNDRRVLAGVASGIGDYLDVSPWIPRLVFIFMTSFGGFGLLAYVGAWLLIRREDEADSVAERFWARVQSGQNWLGALLVFVAALLVIASFDFLDAGPVFAVGLLAVGVLLYRENIGGPDRSAAVAPAAMEQQAQTDTDTMVSNWARPVREPAAPRPPRPPRRPRERSPLGRWTIGVALVALGVLAALDVSGAVEPFPRHYAAAVLAVLGGGLLVGTVAGRARWLIVPGLLILPVVVGASFVDIPLDGNFTVETIRITPDSQADLLDVYDLETGSMTLDLSNIAFTGADSVRVDMGAGQLRVIVPREVAANVDVRLGMGTIGGAIGNSDGIGLRRITELSGTAGPLDLDIELGAGEVDVIRGG